MMDLLKSPSLESGFIALSNSFNNKLSCIVNGRCRIWYSGRAESFLDSGERLVIIKKDGTILVHRGEGSTPVNWMPATTFHAVSVSNDKLVLTSVLQKDGQQLKMEFDKLNFISSFALDDSADFVSAGSEKEMARMVYNNPGLIGSGFKPLSLEEHTRYGFIDIFGYDKENVLTVVECKRYSAGLDAVTQLRRYVERVKKSKGLAKVNGIIAAPKITPNALVMLQDYGFSFVKVEPPKYFEDVKKKQKKLDHFN
jgi:RecB family endonuclease NucS